MLTNFCPLFVWNSNYKGAASAGNIYYPNVNLASPPPFPSTSCIPIPNSSVGFPICNSTFLAFIQNLSAGVPPFLNGLLNFGANTTNASANTGKFYTIDSLIYNYALTTNSLNLAQMLSQNTSAIATNTVEQNQINFNAIYHSYLTNPASITPAQLTSLQNIAQLCPFTNGTSVYQARAVLRYFNDSTYYTNPCEYNLPNVAGSGSRLGILQNNVVDIIEENSNVQVYPNPSNGELNINLPVEGAEIEITNTLGQLVYKTKLNKENKLLINDLKPGVYLYSIISTNAVLKTDKLVLTK
ncbi:MAG: T9SS type A sorting domain-containing protein [Bacteroidia bacterium]